jgi:uncharacterized membrane protein
MVAGYAFGTILLRDVAQRRRTLVSLGFAMIGAFLVLRVLNIYGDLHPWSIQKDAVTTFFSFMNVTKYPPSLDYLLITLGPSIVALAYLENWKGALGKFFVAFGRVPMFYYIIHIYLIHSLAVLAAVLQGFTAESLLNPMWAFPEGYGFGLGVVYLVWIAVVLVLYPACRWYYELKRRRQSALFSYI